MQKKGELWKKNKIKQNKKIKQKFQQYKLKTEYMLLVAKIGLTSTAKTIKMVH